MKEIKFFNNYNVKSFRFWLFVFSGIAMVMLLLEMFFLEDSILRPYIRVSAYLGFALYYLTPFLYRNSVEWNKRGITLKLNTLVFSRTFSFEDIKSVEFLEKELRVTRHDDLVRTLDLTGITPKSIEKLKAVFQQHYVKFRVEQDFQEPIIC
ncbi:hypothetical protein CKY20_00145 [Capnocytophaga canis]|uniref:Uncharacterized protein n=1 Tax=Capnocytophaga canis TaxID=1848903 RepID=A0A3A1YK01_9FLAO|nr:hypothetical protein [Capnocytophaga canis]RIY37995.1 hypothetical protein CKY20_00145 [Capnocytophaga canis]